MNNELRQQGKKNNEEYEARQEALRKLNADKEPNRTDTWDDLFHVLIIVNIIIDLIWLLKVWVLPLVLFLIIITFFSMEVH